MKMSFVTGFDLTDVPGKGTAERVLIRNQRLHDLCSAEGTLAIEGLSASPVAVRLMERYADSQVSIDEAVAALKQHHRVPTP